MSAIEIHRGLIFVFVPLWRLWQHGQHHWGNLQFEVINVHIRNWLIPPDDLVGHDSNRVISKWSSKSHPVDYIKMVEALNGAAHAITALATRGHYPSLCQLIVHIPESGMRTLRVPPGQSKRPLSPSDNTLFTFNGHFQVQVKQTWPDHVYQYKAVSHLWSVFSRTWLVPVKPSNSTLELKASFTALFSLFPSSQGLIKACLWHQVWAINCQVEQKTSRLRTS
jgi:hypothetical protein